MKLTETYGSDRFGLSFELFPPKTEAGMATLDRHVQVLMNHAPDFITCTYGAGGSTREKTLEIVTSVKQRFGLPVASHLTCVGSTVDELRNYLGLATERGIDSIVALRGDPPRGETQFTATEGGLSYANELVTLIKDEFPDFGIAVAGYPETHRDAASPEDDLRNLKRKVDSGGDAVITQLFYDNTDYFRFRDRCEQIGITAPIVPGILPVTNLSQIQRITTLCGSRLPTEFLSRLSEQDSEDWQFDTGVEHAVHQVQDLIEQDVPGIHFYVLNKSQATSKILESVRIPHRRESV